MLFGRYAIVTGIAKNFTGSHTNNFVSNLLNNTKNGRKESFSLKKKRNNEKNRRG